MAYLLGILVMVIGLVISVGLHEIGHMAPAKLFGVKVPQYFIGFGTTLWSTKRGETEYGIKAIPLGGFVRLSGMFLPQPRKNRDEREVIQEAREAAAKEIEPGEESRAFYNLSVPKKLCVMFGGPVMNLIIAYALMILIVVGWGLPTPSTTVSSVRECISGESQCTEPGPAYAAGIRAGDTIIGYAGKPVNSWEEFTAAVAAQGTQPAEIIYRSNGEEHRATLTPATLTADGKSRPVVGVTAGQERRPGTVGQAFAMTNDGLKQTAGVVLSLPQRLYDVTRSLFTSAPREDGVMSIVGVGRIAGEISSLPSHSDGTTVQGPSVGDKFMTLLSLLASLNLALFVFNLIPLLPLDGGHIAGALWEGLRRTVARLRGQPDPGPADTVRLLPLAYGVFVVLMAMTLILVVADIIKPVKL